MTKPELVSQISRKSGLTLKDSEKALMAFTEAVSEALAKGETVQLVGFGSFERRTRKARKGRNPRTGAELRIPTRQVPAFRAGKGLKEAVGQR